MSDVPVITKEIAAKVLETIDAGLSGGLGEPVPGQMCVEAAVCFALGLEHGDDPKCVGPAIRNLKISLNDINWPTDKLRAKGLRRLGLIQLGSLGTVDEKALIYKVALWIANTHMKNYLATYPTNNGQRKVRDLVSLFDKKIVNVKVLQKKLNFIYNYMESEFAYVDDFIDELKDVLECADDIQVNNERYDQNWSYSSCGEKLSDILKLVWDNAKNNHEKLDILNQYAEAVVQILIKLKAPGRKWLALTIEPAKK